jgi:hypothetical protein
MGNAADQDKSVVNTVIFVGIGHTDTFSDIFIFSTEKPKVTVHAVLPLTNLVPLFISIISSSP